MPAAEIACVAVSLGTAICLCSTPAKANNGMVAPGNGSVQLGMAGAGTAMAEDAAATLRNPAAGAWLDSGVSADLGIAIPDGGYVAGKVGSDARIGLLDLRSGRSTSVAGVFPVPSIARNWRISDQTAWGWGLTAAGLKSLSRGNAATLARGIPLFEAHCDGDFGGGSAVTPATDMARLCGRKGTALGVDLSQIFLSAHWAYQPVPELALGVAPVVAAQRIQLRGLGAFAAFSNFPGKVTNNGYDYSYGGGLRLGILWDLGYGVEFGAAYQSRLYQTEFDRYRGAILDGSLDFSPVLNAGLQFHPAPNHLVALDVERVEYGAIRTLVSKVEPQRFTDECFVPRLLTRSLPNPPALDACLGGATGPGFGWHSVTIYKLGYQGNDGRLTWRVGYSIGGNPVGNDQVLPAVFAPAVTDRHASAGLSWQLNSRLSVNGALIYSIKNSVRARNTLSSATPSVLAGSPPVSFDVGADPADQVIENHISVWQTQLGVSWSSDF